MSPVPRSSIQQPPFVISPVDAAPRKPLPRACPPLADPAVRDSSCTLDGASERGGGAAQRRLESLEDGNTARPS